MAGRGKPDAPKTGRNKPRLSPEPKDREQLDANETLLLNMKQMMDELRADINGQFDSTISAVVKREITAVLEPFEKKIATHGGAIADLERSASDHDYKLTELQNKVSSLNTLVDSLSKKCEDLEGRSRLNNVRLVGLPEGAEGPRPTEFMAKFLQDLLGLSDRPVLDPAHRTLRARPKDGDPPRPMIIRVHLFQVRNDILRRAGEASPLSHSGRRISIFPDFTSTVARKRATFIGVKKELHSCPNIKFGLLHPAILRITLPDGQTHRFEDPASASEFVKKKIKKGVSPDAD